MRLNRFIAGATGISRRSADQAIALGRIQINNRVGVPGDDVGPNDSIFFDQKILKMKPALTLQLNKPVGYVCSRNGQGSPTIYELLPKKFHHLKTVGRLDKDSSGLLIMTNDGELANKLTHPSHQKTKQYEVELDHKINQKDFGKVTTSGVSLNDGLSKFDLKKLGAKGNKWLVTLQEGRNRQIRRTFEALDYNVIFLHRIKIGDYSLRELKSGSYQLLDQ